MGVTNVVVNSSTTADGKTQWTITTNNGTYTAIDNNGNGRLDDGELQSALNSSGNAMTPDELLGARFQIAMGNNPTTQEILGYNQYQQMQNTITEQQHPQKKGFWGKVGNFFKGIGKGIGSFFKNIGSLMLPIGMGMMAYGGIKSMTGSGNWMSNMNWTMGGAALATAGLMNQYTNTLNAMTSTSTGSTTFDVASVGSNLNNYNLEQMLGSVSTVPTAGITGITGTADTTTASGNTNKQKLITDLTNAYNNATTLNPTNKANLDWIKDNIIGKKPEDLTDEDLKIAEQIKKNPIISYQVIGDGTNQITLQESNSIPGIKATYIAQGKTNPSDPTQSDNQLKVMTPEEYERMIELSKKETLTESEATELKRLINTASTNIDKYGLKDS